MKPANNEMELGTAQSFGSHKWDHSPHTSALATGKEKRCPAKKRLKVPIPTVRDTTGHASHGYGLLQHSSQPLLSNHTLLQYFSSTLFPNTCLQNSSPTSLKDFSTTLFSNTSLQHSKNLLTRLCNASLQHSSPTLPYNTLLQHFPTTFFSGTSLQHSSPALLSNNSLNHSSPTLLYNALFQKFPTTLFSHTSLQHSLVDSVDSLVLFLVKCLQFIKLYGFFILPNLEISHGLSFLPELFKSLWIRHHLIS